jgi:mitogen-activated protein kinase 1/3
MNAFFFQRPLFPGKHYIEQINLILNVVGSPDEGDLTSIGKYKISKNKNIK